MRLLNLLATVSALSLALAGNLFAQGKGSVEVGFDAGVNIQIIDEIDETDVHFGFPSQGLGGLSILSLQTVRFGFYTSDHLQLDTTMGFTLFAPDDSDEAITQLGFGLEPLWNFSGEKTVPYIKGGGLFRLFDFGDNAESQVGIRGGAGVKLKTSERVAVRLEGTVARWFETDAIRGHTDIGGAVGLSVFTK